MPKQDLEYWKRKLVSVQYQIKDHESNASYHEQFLNYIQPFKLKRMHNCALVGKRFYIFQPKVERNRKRFLKNRLYHLTQAAFHRKEIRRLNKTKVPFYKNKIWQLTKTGKLG